jgi:acyl-CoA hydrolase
MENTPADAVPVPTEGTDSTKNSRGTESLPPRSVEHSQDYLAEVMGEEARAGERIQAGPILRMMYDTAVAVAFKHCGHRPVLLRLDRVDLTREISHMDLMRIDGRMTEVGRSTMMIELRCFAKNPSERQFHPRHMGFMTMVAIDDAGQPIRNLPPLSYDSPQGREAKALAAHRNAQMEERRMALEWIDREEGLRVKDVIEPDRPERYQYLKPDQTEVRIKRRVISQSPFLDGRVRAGDLLEWLDRVANYTARQFTGNPNTVTLSVNDLVFTRPLHAADRIELISRVVYVRTHTLEVAIDIIVHTLAGESYTLHRVEFFLITFSPSGGKQRITTGLELSEDNQEAMRMYLKARTRYSFWKAHPESHLIQSPT